jgi:hypothetical protein
MTKFQLRFFFSLCLKTHQSSRRWVEEMEAESLIYRSPGCASIRSESSTSIALQLLEFRNRQGQRVERGDIGAKAFAANFFHSMRDFGANSNLKSFSPRAAKPTQ